MMGGMGIFGMVAGLLFLVVLVAGAVWLIQALARGGGAGPMVSSGETPLEILKRRYAKGEITKEQYDDMRRDLGA
jgi:putative membrane protein